MNNSPEKLQNIKSEASEWLMRRRFDSSGSFDSEAFELWLQEDPRHQKVYRLAEQAWVDLQEMQTDPELTKLAAAPSRRFLSGWLGRRFLLWGSLASAAAAVLIMVLGLPRPEQREVAFHQEYRTNTAEIREVVLPDGSSVVMGGKTSLSVDFSQVERKVSLASGEAYFNVSKDASRLFSVSSEKAMVNVLGTRFDVRYGADMLRVSVAEGAIEVVEADPINADARAERRQLGAGEQLVVSADGALGHVEPVQSEASGTWTSGRFGYFRVPLKQMVADANRYYSGEIRLQSAAVGDLLVNTSFRISQIDGMLESLPGALPIVVRHEAGNVVVLALREDIKSDF